MIFRGVGWESGQERGSRRRGYMYTYSWFPGGSDGKEPACNVGDPDLIPGLGRSPGEGNGNPLQYSCLKNFMDRGAKRASPWGLRVGHDRASNTHTQSFLDSGTTHSTDIEFTHQLLAEIIGSDRQGICYVTVRSRVVYLPLWSPWGEHIRTPGTELSLPASPSSHVG